MMMMIVKTVIIIISSGSSSSIMIVFKGAVHRNLHVSVEAQYNCLRGSVAEIVPLCMLISREAQENL